MTEYNIFHLSVEQEEQAHLSVVRACLLGGVKKSLNAGKTFKKYMPEDLDQMNVRE